MADYSHRLPGLVFFGLLAGLMYSGCTQEEGASDLKKPNILFIAIDDLRPELGAYGESHMITPNLDQLAQEGRLFTRHFVQVPTCGASRYALLTGKRPVSPEHLNNQVFERLSGLEQAQPESFAHLFRQNGYYTASIGKISHMPDGRVYTYEGEGDGALEMPLSWDKVWGPVGKWGTAWNAFFGYADGSNRNMQRGAYPAFEFAAVPDTAYPDGLIAEEAIRVLREVKSDPFLLAVGFYKPHLPFTAPQKYWDLYDTTEIEVSPNPERPQGIQEGALHPSNEMFRNYGPHESKGGAGVQIDTTYARKLRRAYFASVSYVDAQVGKVLDALKELGLSENTIVVVWGDHGWHLGDHTLWGKHATFDRALRSALIIRTPAMEKAGVSADGLVETLDLYPTLAALAGLELPEGLGGESIVPLLNDPSNPGKDAALSYWRNRRSMRTDQYRITVFDDGGVELFDHFTDPLETENIATNHPEIVATLIEQLEGQQPVLMDNP